MMVFLGFGKFWRSDKIVGLMPIDAQRGPGKRTEVYVEGQSQPIIASRTEDAILADMSAGAGGHTEALRAATAELLEAFHEFSPVLRRALEHEHHFDVEKWEQRLSALLKPPVPGVRFLQDDLFA
jgi:hypothetical protein